MRSNDAIVDRVTVIVARLVMEKSGDIVALVILILVMIKMVVCARILMSGQILPLDHFLDQFDIIFVNLWTAIH